MSDIEKQLIDNYVLQKEKLLERAGSRTKLDRNRMSALMKPHMEKVALIVQDWDIDPGLLIEAAFAWAKRNKHPDGPLPAMLYSVKYLSKAISHHLELPFEVVAEKRSTAVLMQKLDEEYARMLPGMAIGLPVASLPMAASFPLEFRYAFALSIPRLDVCNQMAPELLEWMGRDRKTSMWLEKQGITYERIAKYFNHVP